MTGQEKDESYVVINESRGVVELSIGTSKESYELFLELSREYADRTIFSRYGISHEQFKTVLEEFDAINDKPLSEVGGQVNDLVSRLKEETGETQ